MAETYFWAISRFAWRRSLAMTDSLSILAAVLIPAVSHVVGKAMADDFAGYVAWAIIIVVVGGIGLRLITAPYFIWCEQNKTIAELRVELNRPEQSIKARMHADEGETRIALLNQLMRIHARYGVEAYNPAEYDKSLRHEGAAIPAAKLIHDEKFARLWSAHIELLKDAAKWAESNVYMLKVGFDRVEKSHQ